MNRLAIASASGSPAVGIVVATGKCSKTIRVQVPKLKWNSHIRKDYKSFTHHLVHDGAEACVPGDCVRILPNHVTSKSKTHIVAEIVSPMRTGEERRPLQSVEEWVRKKEEKRNAKIERRGVREREAKEEKEKEATAKEAKYLKEGTGTAGTAGTLENVAESVVGV